MPVLRPHSRSARRRRDERDSARRPRRRRGGSAGANPHPRRGMHRWRPLRLLSSAQGLVKFWSSGRDRRWKPAVKRLGAEPRR